MEYHAGPPVSCLRRLSALAPCTSWPTQLKLCSSSLCIYICKLRPDAHADTDTDASAATNMKLKEVNARCVTVHVRQSDQVRWYHACAHDHNHTVPRSQLIIVCVAGTPYQIMGRGHSFQQPAAHVPRNLHMFEQSSSWSCVRLNGATDRSRSSTDVLIQIQ
jgi:hypothetical protein